MPDLFTRFPGRSAPVDIRFLPEDLAQLVVGSLAVLKFCPVSIEQIFNVSFTLDDIAQYIGFNLIRHERVVNQFQLSGLDLIEGKVG